ncbi:hypothetical protein BJY52DRAFT_1406437 [Lactarius psammicola]|nr:hypothetical protein BJY52DRAFT_1406437 [Lactarius psammicola]
MLLKASQIGGFPNHRELVWPKQEMDWSHYGINPSSTSVIGIQPLWSAPTNMRASVSGYARAHHVVMVAHASVMLCLWYWQSGIGRSDSLASHEKGISTVPTIKAVDVQARRRCHDCVAYRVAPYHTQRGVNVSRILGRREQSDLSFPSEGVKMHVDPGAVHPYQVIGCQDGFRAMAIPWIWHSHRLVLLDVVQCSPWHSCHKRPTQTMAVSYKRPYHAAAISYTCFLQTSNLPRQREGNGPKGKPGHQRHPGPLTLIAAGLMFRRRQSHEPGQDSLGFQNGRSGLIHPEGYLGVKDEARGSSLYYSNKPGALSNTAPVPLLRALDSSPLSLLPECIVGPPDKGWAQPSALQPSNFKLQRLNTRPMHHCQHGPASYIRSHYRRLVARPNGAGALRP